MSAPPHRANNQVAASLVDGHQLRQALAAYHPLTGGWLVGWRHENNNIRFRYLTAGLADLRDSARLVHAQL